MVMRYHTQEPKTQSEKIEDVVGEGINMKSTDKSEMRVRVGEEGKRGSIDFFDPFVD